MRPRNLLALIGVLLAGGVAPSIALAAGGSASASSSAAATTTVIAGGWGKDTSTYIGKYKVIGAPGSSSSAATTTAAAGVFTVALRTASALDAASGPVSSGALTTFIRKVKTGEPLEPSGILSLFGPSGSQVLYLTDMALHGKQRVATVNGGSFLGTPIGTLTASPAGHGSLAAVIKATGLGTAHVRLTDFNAAPPTS